MGVLVTDFTNLTNEQLAESIGDHLREVEARMAAANVADRTQKRVARLHASMADIGADLIDSGTIQPFSGGEPKPT